jgi:hypothetical protein
MSLILAKRKSLSGATGVTNPSYMTAGLATCLPLGIRHSRKLRTASLQRKLLKQLNDFGYELGVVSYSFTRLKSGVVLRGLLDESDSKSRNCLQGCM